MSAEISRPTAPDNAENLSKPVREAEPASQMRYAHASWRALGTYVQLVVARGDLFEAAREEAVKVLAQVDAGCSRFRDDSDLSRANRESGRWVKVGPILAEAVKAALWAANETNGLVDPTLGRNLAAIGYDRDLRQVQADHGPAGIPIPAVTEAWRQVKVRVDGDEAEALVPFGVALDLGATGKGFTADLVARRIVENVGTDLVVSIGGDVAIGSVDPDGEPQEWPIAVGELPGGEPEQTVLLSRGGMATSSTLHRRWTRGEDSLHHLLDPRTGRPVERCWRTVSVTAPSCLAANTASTASIVIGEQAPEWLTERDLAARLVGTDGAVVTVAGWPEEGN
jgi:thiamine biosynthesis lipoprotein